MAERRAVVANDFRITGDEPSVRRERERIDLDELEVLAPGDLRKAHGIACQPRGHVAREQLRQLGIERVGGGVGRAIEGNPKQRLGGLDVLAALCRDQKLEPLTRAVDADREVDFARDRHRLLEQERRFGIVEGGGDARPRRRELAQVREPMHQPALAAAALQNLRLEQVPRP